LARISTGDTRVVALPRSLRCLAVVVSQKIAEPFAALVLAIVSANFVTGLYDTIGQPLVISFFVVVQ
jgi:hypothetical protein